MNFRLPWLQKTYKNYDPKGVFWESGILYVQKTINSYDCNIQKHVFKVCGEGDFCKIKIGYIGYMTGENIQEPLDELLRSCGISNS